MPSYWQPTAPLKNLKRRAKLYHDLRAFFASKNVLEVETPLLCKDTVTDEHIESISAGDFYLQTSPEYAMKRLLAAEYGSIYQICKAFRKGEIGNKHNPEFTMLEWYRIGFTHHDLMHEINELLQILCNTPNATHTTYQAIFQKILNLDPLTATLDSLTTHIDKHTSLSTASKASLTKDTALECLFSHCIEPILGLDAPCFIYNFPASQAALSKINQEDPRVAERFELYWQGVELANGFHELTNADEQLKRFKNNQEQRKQNNQTIPGIDEHFISALKHGLPNCAGVALGIDRLLMLLCNTSDIRDVIAFPINSPSDQ